LIVKAWALRILAAVFLIPSFAWWSLGFLPPSWYFWYKTNAHPIVKLAPAIGLLVSVVFVTIMFALPQGGLRAKNLSRASAFILGIYTFYALASFLMWFATATPLQSLSAPSKP
jgi:hypothetical protein